MTPHERALELLALAREDERAASVLDTAGMGDTLVGFHHQQAVEKVLKALLAERSVDFPKTHDLLRLLRLAKAEGYEVPAVEEVEEVEGAKQLDRPEVQKLVRRLQSWAEAELL